MIDDALVGEIRMFAHANPPEGWLPCDGRTLKIFAHPALFSLIGTQFGGDSKTTFWLPDLRGRIPMHIRDGFLVGALAPAAQSGTESEQQPYAAVAYYIASEGFFPTRP